MLDSEHGEGACTCERQAGVRPASADIELWIDVGHPFFPLLICFGSTLHVPVVLSTPIISLPYQRAPLHQHQAMASAATVAPEADAPVKVYAAPQFTPGLLLNLRAIGEKDDDEMETHEIYLRANWHCTIHQ